MTRLLSALVSLLIIGCSGGGEKQQQDNIKTEQYLVEGKRLYSQYCSMCHQSDGAGLAQLYPPLNKSDFMEENVEEVACIIKNGRTEPIVVNGVTYNQQMPAMSTLTNLEIAQIMTYIYNTWEHEKGLIGVKEVDEFLQNCN